MILTIQGTPDLFLDLEPEVTETAAAGLPLRGSQMDATIRDSDGSGKCDLFLSFSPSVSYRQHPSEVHARAAYEAKNFIGWARLALTYPPKLQKRRIFNTNIPAIPFGVKKMTSKQDLSAYRFPPLTYFIRYPEITLHPCVILVTKKRTLK